MKYAAFIEEYFRIDEADTGALVPFKLRPVQAKYYRQLVEEYDIERRGLTTPVRDIILKARREGFSSLILALFAADDILSRNPTESEVISYKDDATAKFRRRYKGFVTSYFEKRWGETDERRIFKAADGGDFILAENGAHFFCGTASSRTAERGGVLHKLLLTEAAHYPDLEKLSASEIIEGTIRQVDIKAGWVLIESTANGYGNHYQETWALAERGESRFKPRFFSWRDHYTPDEFALIASEFTDKRLLKQEYPETPEEAFLVTGASYFNNERVNYLLRFKAKDPAHVGFLSADGAGGVRFVDDAAEALKVWAMPDPYEGYVIGGDVAEGIEDGDYSTLRVLSARTGRLVAKYKARVPPDEFARVAYLLATFYNTAYLAIEVNKDGLWVNAELVSMGYPNIHFQEVMDEVTHQQRKKFGWRTDTQSRPTMLAELQKALTEDEDAWVDAEFLRECLTFIRNRVGKPEAMRGANDDEIVAHAIALIVRQNAPTQAKERPKEPVSLKAELWGRVQADLDAIANPDAGETMNED